MGDTIYEYRGIRGLVAARVLKDDSTGMEFDTPIPIAGVSELGKETSSGSEPHYYDNVPAVVVDSVGADTVTMALAAIPFSTLAEVTGQFYDETLGMFVEGERDSEYWAMGYITKRTDGVEVFVWRLKGSFNIPPSTHATENDGTDANGQELVFTGINTNCKFALVKNGVTKMRTVKAVNIEQDINPQDEAEFFATVQTPSTVKATATA